MQRLESAAEAKLPKDWTAEYQSLDVTFKCAVGNDVGECIKVFHSESEQVYQDHKFLAMNRPEKKDNQDDCDY